ncbi:BZ3500_MvSof-1268-A1-R1_Chr10-2g03047 [Microbotryum saponariae]|uniref:BZ3500_MvSof-1268-A1-R1_Chr10-2g03047 protein n=1 Tax=Microbotryum saponariae TaxID=289078 RepID=A0A2X0NAK7_9BASI|nr:BZ3501_MvSof-1269-A2-R1_Chr10-2g02633 [Microbotryum saponariae]SDA01987.1 BZ3500_MvSof-1268-A1-R1_Chr10-2g03047 [Microbotryum saponariae]
MSSTSASYMGRSEGGRSSLSTTTTYGAVGAGAPSSSSTLSATQLQALNQQHYNNNNNNNNGSPNGDYTSSHHAMSVLDDELDEVDDEHSNSPAGQGGSSTAGGNRSGTPTQQHRMTGSQATDPTAPRSGRACLACRKLKLTDYPIFHALLSLLHYKITTSLTIRAVPTTRDPARTVFTDIFSLFDPPSAPTRCDGAEDPPCKRCRAGNHECVFVESKRGKRPAKPPGGTPNTKASNLPNISASNNSADNSQHALGSSSGGVADHPTTTSNGNGSGNDAALAEKFRSVEKNLSLFLQSMNSGGAPDPNALQQLQSTLADGIDTSRNGKSINNGTRATSTTMESPTSAGDDSHAGGSASIPPAKRPRHASGNYPQSNSSTDSPFTTNNMSLSPNSVLNSARIPTLPLSQTPASTDSAQLPSASRTPGSAGGGSSLSMLADASLAAQLDGRNKLTGLDPGFNLSRVTEAIQGDGSEGEDEARTPALLSKGIITPETAVDMFRIFFDFCYIHLPLLDPAQNSATSVCARSPFLFTAICAVASRFNPDPTLHVKCYDEAHACFVDTVANGERSIESVQALMILTVWTSAPKKDAEDRPQRAWLYFGMAVRMGLELGLFRPPPFVDHHLSTSRNASQANPWANLKDVSEEEQRDAINRERTWLMGFVIDRNMSAVMGRPYQIHEAKPLLIPLHTMSLPFDLGVIAHQELQMIIGQVMDTFRDRIYGLSSASDEMPSATVMKIFNNRMDDWRQRWCPVAGEPIANNLLFYFFSSKLFLNTIPLHTMLRNGEVADDPECVSTTITAAKSVLDLAHKYAELGVLLHCPDVNFLLILYGAVFLIKVKVSNTRFSQLVDADELQQLLVQAIYDCQAATCSPRHAASTACTMLRALLASFKAMLQAQQNPANSHGMSRQQTNPNEAGGRLPHGGLAADGSSDPFGANGSSSGPPGSALGLHGTLAGAPMSPSASYPFMSTPFAQRNHDNRSFFGSGAVATGGSGTMSGTHTPAGHQTYGAGGGAGSAGSAGASNTGFNPMDPLDSFLNDTNFFSSVLVSQGADGFFTWPEGLDAAGGLDINFDSNTFNPSHLDAEMNGPLAA